MSIDIFLSRPFAHRGLHDNRSGVPENSMAAFQMAMDNGYAIELDIRLLGDGNAVVFHDATIERMTGQSGHVLDLDSRRMSRLPMLGTRETPPLLADVLDLVRGKVPLYIEIKNGNRPGRLESRAWSLLDSYRAAHGGSFAVASFNPLVLAWFRRKAPDFLRVQITGSPGTCGMRPHEKTLVRNWPLTALGQPHALAAALHILASPLVGAQRCQGRPVIAWTVRSPADLDRAMRFADAYVFEGFRP